MSPGMIAALALVAGASAYMVVRSLNPDSAFAAAGAAGDDLGGSSADGASTPPPSRVSMQWNPLIAQAAAAARIDPVLLKAIAASETGFRPDAINPEKDFIL